MQLPLIVLILDFSILRDERIAEGGQDLAIGVAEHGVFGEAEEGGEEDDVVLIA